MSTVVDSFPPPNGFARKYPWERWSDGKIHELARGEDFHVGPYSFKNAALKHAIQHGLRVTATIRHDRVWLQFMPEASR